MIRRRRRRKQDVAFGFDSFLDVVANVCGIIIRLMLVVWVGARSYSALKYAPPPPEPPSEVAVADPPEPPEPLLEELDAERQRLAEAEKALLHQLTQWKTAQTDHEQQQQARAALRAQQAKLAGRLNVAEQDVLAQGHARAAVLPSLEELRERSRRLAEEVKAQEGLPPVRRQLRYRTPVSKPVDAEELMFECRQGRVTFIDIAALLEEVKRGMRIKEEALRRTWEVNDVVGPAGPFQLRYTVERQREGLSGASPDPGANFRYGVSGWRVEPITETRGETLEEALKATSEFRQIADSLDKDHAAVTFWVYPESFSLYRELRDYLYQRDLVVAGRPLSAGTSIASSRQGSASRGQ